jgi:hypothetical protein
MPRPVPVSIFGILNIVFGVYALYSVFATLSTLSITGETKNEIAKIIHDVPAYATWVKCTIPLGLLSFVLLVPAGVGLLRLAEWARNLSIAYGVYAILFDIAVAITNYRYVLPRVLGEAFRANGGSSVPLAVVAIMGGLFGMIYPVALIVFMMRKEIVAAFRPPALPPDLPSA